MSASPLIEKCCLLGPDIGGDPTHFMIERAFEAAGIDWRFMTFECKPDRLEDALRGFDALGFNGVNLAEPYRAAAASLIPQLSDAARFSRSVGTLIARPGGFVGDNFVGAALMRSAEQRAPLAGLNAVLLGAGPAAASAGLALARSGVASLLVAEPDPEAAEALAQALRSVEGVASGFRVEAGGYDDQDELALDPTVGLIIRPAEIDSSGSAPAWIDFSTVRPGMLVIDATIESGRTGLLRESSARGASVVEGVAVLAWETAMTIEAWTGTPVSHEVLVDAAEEFLGL